MSDDFTSSMLILSRLWFRETTHSNRLRCNLRFVRQAELDNRCFAVVLLLTSLSDNSTSSQQNQRMLARNAQQAHSRLEVPVKSSYTRIIQPPPKRMEEISHGRQTLLVALGTAIGFHEHVDPLSYPMFLRHPTAVNLHLSKTLLS